MGPALCLSTHYSLLTTHYSLLTAHYSLLTTRWVLLSVSNNCLYDEGIAKLVAVLQKTTAPLETLDLSKTGMTSVGAKLVAQLLIAEGETPLPLRRLIFHGNAIGPDGFAAVCTAETPPADIMCIR